MKIVRRVIIILVFLGVVGGAGYYKYINTITYYNEPGTNGNTTGNLYGNGLFCEIDGIVYFANPNDYSRIYTMKPDESDIKILANDSVYYINADPHYLYYSRNGNRDYSEMGFLNVNIDSLCRMNRKTKKVIILDDAICSVTSLAGNKVLYYRYDSEDATSLYCVDIDGKNKEQISKVPLDPRFLVGEKMYFAGVEQDHNLHTLNLDTKDIGFVSSENLWMPMKIDNELFFIDLDHKHRIYRMPFGGGDKVGVTTYGAVEYNIDGNFLYYQSLKGNPDGLYRVDLLSGAEVLIADGQFNHINITSKYLYFSDYYSGSMFHVPRGSTDVGVFDPPIQSLDK